MIAFDFSKTISLSVMPNKNMTYLICFVAVVAICLFISCTRSNDKTKSATSKSETLANGFSRKIDAIWFHDIALENVDPLTFEIVDDYFFKDKDNVYFYETYRVSQDYFTSKRKRYLPLENADPASFSSLGDGYAKDKFTAWYLDNPFKVADLTSLSVLNHHFVKDDKTAYLSREAITGSDGKTFELISDYYAKDSQQFYFCKPVDGHYEIKSIPCHHASFEVIDHQFAKDDTSVFFEGDKLSNAEGNSFELISDGYAKDSRHVYFRNRIVEKADPSTFSTFTENENSMGAIVYAKDKNGLYANEKSFSEVDGVTFKILNENYTLDKNGVYYQMKKVENADASSFKVYPHLMGDADAEDKNHKYGEGKVVE